MKKRIILASASPRRQQFFKDLHLDYQVVIKPVEEVYPPELQREEITNFLAELKAQPFEGFLEENDILITSDTMVWCENKALGKPKNYQDAFEMLRSLSGKMHEVITSVCFTTTSAQKTEFCVSKVYFKTLTDSEIDFYIKEYSPYDKAGSYGIQEWIGHIGVTHIEGSYNNIMGLPTHLIHSTLQNF